MAECRALESARCEAVAPCGYPDVGACMRFVREQCLHGLYSDVPEPRALNACLQDLEAAGQCVRQAESGEEAEVRSGDCSPPLRVEGSVRRVCEVLQRPEALSACAEFATPPAQSPPTESPPTESPPAPEQPDAG